MIGFLDALLVLVELYVSVLACFPFSTLTQPRIPIQLSSLFAGVAGQGHYHVSETDVLQAQVLLPRRHVSLQAGEVGPQHLMCNSADHGLITQPLFDFDYSCIRATHVLRNC